MPHRDEPSFDGIDIDVDPTRAVHDTLPQQVPVPVDVPPHLGRYTLLGLLGKGGMAEVYLAMQDGPAGFAKQCVVKRIRRSLAEEPRFVEMFLREARVAARLNHPNAVQIFELGQDGGEYFLAMEFLDGVSLHRAARRSWAHGESVPMEVVLRAAADAALGLHHAHSLTGADGRSTPLIHRDVSPDNIILTRDGVSKVLDFGIAKSTDLEEVTGTGEVKGKIPFMSPEQLQGLALDRRSDLWSLGVTIYWLLTGRRPFDAQTEPMTIDGILRRDPKPPRELNPLIPPSLESVVLQLLAKDRDQRIDSGAALADQLIALLGPSAGYGAAAAFAAKAAAWPDPDGKQPLSALTILAARPESQWLKRLGSDDGGPQALDRLFPEHTPTGAQRARPVAVIEPVAPSTARTVTGLHADKLTERPLRLLPIAAGGAAAVLLAAGAFFVWHGARDDAAAVDAAPWVVSVATPAPAAAPPADPPPTTPPPVPATTTPGHEAAPASAAHQPSRREEHRAAAEARATVRATAPSYVSWRAGGRHVGSGSGALHIPRGTTSLTALDGETGGVITVPVVDGAASFAAVPTGVLRVRVNPWADVQIGRKRLGTTPIDPVTLKAGHYTVQLVRENMHKTLGVDVRAGGTATVTADLRD